MRKPSTLIMREQYLSRLIAFSDTDSIKVITGIRRCGKSSMLKLMVRYLIEERGIDPEQIVEMNFESLEFSQMDVMALYEFIRSKIIPGKRMYLFFDEIQRISRWQDAVNSFRVDFDCDQYITGSNAYLLSSEFSTYLSGRYVEIQMLPLSFKEFLTFQGYRVTISNAPDGTEARRIVDDEGRPFSIADILRVYIRYGGLPGLGDIALEQEHALILLDGVFSTVVLRDILLRERRRGQRQISDSFLLKKISLFLADNIGNPTSLTSIGKMLVSQRDLDEGHRKSNPAVRTVIAYVTALLESYVFYEIKRFDIKGREYLKTLGKYYIVDPGLRNYLLGFNGLDTGRMLENIVYLELLRRGYDPAVGKVGELEIDFVAIRGDEVLYIQVASSLADEATLEREVRPFRQVANGYAKILITGERYLAASVDGYPVIYLGDWLLGP